MERALFAVGGAGTVGALVTQGEEEGAVNASDAVDTALNWHALAAILFPTVSTVGYFASRVYQRRRIRQIIQRLQAIELDEEQGTALLGNDDEA